MPNRPADKKGLIEKTVGELSQMLRSGETTSRKATAAYLSEIDRRDDKINSFITVARESALTQADAADARIASGENITDLTGIPIALKDIFVTEGIQTTCGSKILEGYTPPFDGTAVTRLKKSGAVILGKLNMDEFAMGSSNEFSAFGATRNPWNLEYVPGGSSGGSAAATAAGLSAATFGTDTGGSIRQPAAFCGTVGLKPTYGRVSRYGIIAFASSLDQLGPITRDVTDAAILLGSVAGHDPHDATSSNTPVVDYLEGLNGDVSGKTIGIPREYFVKGLDEEVENAVRGAISKLEDMGATIKEISLPHTKYALSCYYIIAPAEASANLARYDGIRYGTREKGARDLTELYKMDRMKGFGAEVTLRIILGTYVLSAGYYDAYYLKAQKVRTLIKRDFMEAFESCDAILSPVTPTTPFKFGEMTDDPIKMYLSDIFTIPTSLAGLPGISIPCGLSGNNLPIGLQLIGKPFDEAGLLGIAYALEQSMGWHKKLPIIG